MPPKFFWGGIGEGLRKDACSGAGRGRVDFGGIKKLPGFGAREQICFGGIADYLSMIIFWDLV